MGWDHIPVALVVAAPQDAEGCGSQRAAVEAEEAQPVEAPVAIAVPQVGVRGGLL